MRYMQGTENVVVKTHMKNKDSKLGLLVDVEFGAGLLDILLQLLDGVLERRPGVINLVDDQDALADQAGHVAERGKIQPLSASNLGARLFDDGIGGELLVEGEADGLDRDVGAAGLLEEGPEDTGRDVAAATNGDHQMGLEVGEDLGSRLLAQLVHLFHGKRG